MTGDAGHLTPDTLADSAEGSSRTQRLRPCALTSRSAHAAKPSRPICVL